MTNAEKQSRTKGWIASLGSPNFLINQIISTLGAIVVGVLGVLVVAFISAAFTKNTSGGNFIDHVAEQHAFIFVDQPYHAAPVLCGFTLGALSRRFPRSRGAAWVWIAPLIVLMWNLMTWEGAGPPTSSAHWAGVWANYFGAGCAGSECVYELFVTLPFYTSVAYTLGWLARGLLTRKDSARALWTGREH
jgi:hypothetical protein